MKGPAKRTSEIIKKIKARRDPVKYNRTRGQMWMSAKIAAGIQNKGWSKTEFAKAIKQTPSTVSRWLSGHHNFTLDTLNDIEIVLGIELINWGNRQPEANKEFKGIVHPGMSINIFITDGGYSNISESESVQFQLSEKSDNIQVIKTSHPVLN